MLKAVIVDDEYLIRQYLHNCIDWNAAGYTIVGEIGSAQAALRLVEETDPDLVLTDICMPGIDGISFAGMLKSSCPHLKVVVVTGHDDFDYARRSIHAGVDRYLLKPIDDEELRGTLEELRLQIFKEREQSSLFQTLVDYREHSKKIVQEHYLRGLLEGESGKEMFSREIPESLALPSDALFQVLVFDRSDFSGVLLEGKSRQGSSAWLESYLEQCPQQLSTIFLTDRFGRTVLILQEGHDEINDWLSDLAQDWETRFHFSLWFGIGPVGYGLESIHDSYLQASRNLNNAIALGDSAASAQHSSLFQEHSIHTIDPDEVKKLYQYIVTDSRMQMEGLIDDWFTKFKQSKIIDLSYFKINILNIIFYLYLIDHGQNADADFQEEYAAHYQKMFQIPTLHLVKEYLSAFCITLSKKHENSDSVRPSKLIFEIRQYITDNLADFELSLSGVAKVFYLNSSYLSRIFKQETGVSFVEFLSASRMEKAKALLRDSDLKIYEIAHQVGVDNPNYLGILFKKLEGCSPLEYRAAKRGTTDKTVL